MEHITHIIIETCLETLRIVPFLFLTYLFMEFLEHKAGDKVEKMIVKAGRFGPALGAVLGIAPQCGFSAAAAGLYSGRIITVGTLIAIFLSTSDEMLPVLISEQIPANDILLIVGLKVLIALLAGFVIDFLISFKKDNNKEEHLHIGDMCESEHCHCENGIFKSALRHTIKITLFILIISVVLHLAIHYIGEERIGSLFVSVPFVGNLIAGIIGLIPNCAASVAITQLYVGGIVSLGCLMSGLLVSSGVGLLILFRINRSPRDNLKILLILFGIGVVSGFVIDLFTMLI